MERNEILKIYGTDYKEKYQAPFRTGGSGSGDPVCREQDRHQAQSGFRAAGPVRRHHAPGGGGRDHRISAGTRVPDMVILESSWVGDKTTEAFEYCGYNRIAEQYGVELWDLQQDTSHMEDCAGMQLRLCDSLKQIDFLINVPVLKGHCQTKITCALKNLKGVIPNSEKRRFHTLGLHRPIAHLGAGVPAGFYRGGSYLRGLRLRGRRESGGAQLYHGGQRSGFDGFLCVQAPAL